MAGAVSALVSHSILHSTHIQQYVTLRTTSHSNYAQHKLHSTLLYTNTSHYITFMNTAHNITLTLNTISHTKTSDLNSDKKIMTSFN